MKGVEYIMLDQDMMQKNLSCKNLREAQKNMYCYGISFVPVNFLFLSLGILLFLFASQLNIPLPAAGDEILPLFAAEGHLGFAVLIFFTIGIIAAAFSSADSALTALTTSFCIDIAGISHLSGKEAERRRKLVHFCISVLFIGFILLFKAVNNKSVIDAIYTIASYTYGPLLGLFAFGLFTPMRPRDRFVPYIASLGRLANMFIRLDLPTFERPINAYSGRLSCGHFSTFVLLTTNSALSISIILCFYT